MARGWAGECRWGRECSWATEGSAPSPTERPFPGCPTLGAVVLHACFCRLYWSVTYTEQACSLEPPAQACSGHGAPAAPRLPSPSGPHPWCPPFR